MHKISFDHNQESTLRAVKIDGKALFTHLIADEDKERQNHLVSCLEVFTSDLQKINLPILGNKIAETDFDFSIKINMAWQIGCNIANMPDPQAKKLVKGIKIMSMLKDKKSQFLEKINEEFPNSIQGGNVFMTTIVHGIIAK